MPAIVLVFTNHATAQTYEMGAEIGPGESALEIAWGRGLRVACQIKGWSRFDITATVKNFQG